MSALTQAFCSRLLIRNRARSLFLKRHQSTFSFFSRSLDPVPPTNHALDKNSLKHKSSPIVLCTFPNALKISPAFENAALLLNAIQNKDQETAWMAYSALGRSGQLSSLLPIHHSLLLRSIRPVDPNRFTKEEVSILVDRFNQVWEGMIQCHIQLDMNDYTARLELSVATRQYPMVDSTWAEMRRKAGLTGDYNNNMFGGMKGSGGVGGGGGSLIQPTLYTYNLILQSCVPRKNIGLAMETLNLMKRSGIKPDNMSWDFILQIHTAMKNWKAVESTYRAAFVAAPPGGNTGSQLLQQQLEAQNTFLTLPLGQRARTLNGGAVLSNKGNMNKDKDKLIPTLDNVHTLFSYYAYTQDLEDLQHMFDSHVRLFGLVPITKTYNEMIKFAFLAKREEDAMDLFRELVQIGKNLERAQLGQQSTRESADDNSHSVTDGLNEDRDEDNLSQTIASLAASMSTSVTQIDSTTTTAAPIHPPSAKIQVSGPDFYTFRVLINNELIDARNRWGRAWKWIQVMQDVYGIEPSDSMFRRTLACMKRRKATKSADEATIQALEENWERVRIQREVRRAAHRHQAEDSVAVAATSTSDHMLGSSFFATSSSSSAPAVEGGRKQHLEEPARATTNL
ncbi:hypothetical protein BX616_003181 [Lobosporangium transversale]|uniref:Uncharacterized protein n=1 Tax=Lobosporangium transversale TaxID=64571 RepID=A0A1Y2GZ72_9FUNG|nr:hypothetical protein BCR41DRAFT_345589 [Lobosporangium transversale]KAF9916653.1 hypothetical protein BX616_003181 [Lobosporangium transversale]ORZ27608.1 hypothetical protein BCR41DRAFT_345589 [Lobosporangium transversale]|eukprot:XP_021885311.1 hypothetical protein BCR41DRAFT_345589 [Lobosporangium transversale]